MLSDRIDDRIVAAIDAVASKAPGIDEWWLDLVAPATRLTRQYMRGGFYPAALLPRRPFAYVPFFIPRYLPRFQHAMSAAGLHCAALLKVTEGRVRILDLGAGTGIMTLSCLLELQRACEEQESSAEVDAVLRDGDAAGLEVARQLIESCVALGLFPNLRVDLTISEGDLVEQMPEGPFDFVLLGHVLCEFYQWEARPRDARNSVKALLRRLLPKIVERLSPAGVVVAIEPELYRHTAVPMVIRDFVRNRGELVILAPCLGRTLSCPELQSPLFGRPQCGNTTHSVDWNRRTAAGRRLRLFSEAVGKVPALPYVSYPPTPFYPLVLARGERERPLTDSGMSVWRMVAPARNAGRRVVCIVGANGCESVQIFKVPNAFVGKCPPRAVRLTGSHLVNYDLSALYPHGWPVV